jgi:hypothetical protein
MKTYINFFLENAGELRFIILRRNKGARALQHTPNTNPTLRDYNRARKTENIHHVCVLLINRTGRSSLQYDALSHSVIHSFLVHLFSFNIVLLCLVIGHANTLTPCLLLKLGTEHWWESSCNYSGGIIRNQQI